MKTLAARDRHVRAALRVFGPPTARRRPHGFESLARSLAGQQLSGKAAATIYGRILAYFGGELDPARVARVRVSTLRRLGLSERKAEALRTLAKSTTKGTLPIDRLPRMADEEVISLIASHKGFGVWSAQMYLIFSLGRPDVWPASDLGVRKGVQIIRGSEVLPTIKELEAQGEQFSPHCSAMALFSWHVANTVT